MTAAHFIAAAGHRPEFGACCAGVTRAAFINVAPAAPLVARHTAASSAVVCAAKRDADAFFARGAADGADDRRASGGGGAKRPRRKPRIFRVRRRPPTSSPPPAQAAQAEAHDDDEAKWPRRRRRRPRTTSRAEGKRAAERTHTEFDEEMGDDERSEAARRRLTWMPDYSREFIAICQSQFEELVHEINASQCVLYLRSERPTSEPFDAAHVEPPSPNDSIARDADAAAAAAARLDDDDDDEDELLGGAAAKRADTNVNIALEFVPVCTYPERGSVWIAERASLPPPAPLRLPGGIQPSKLIPEYPFLSSHDDGAVELEDGSLNMPLRTNSTVVGMLAVWKAPRHSPPPTAVPPPSSRPKAFWRSPAAPPTRPAGDDAGGAAAEAPAAPPPSQTRRWSRAERRSIRRVADTLALARELDERFQVAEASHQQQLVLLAQLREVLASVLSEVKSPLGALLTFGKLLLRRLRPGDVSRDLARDIIVQSERMAELLVPLNQRGGGVADGVHEPSTLGLGAQTDADAGGEHAQLSGAPHGASPRAEFALPAVPSGETAPAFNDESFLGFHPVTCWLSDPAEEVYNRNCERAAEVGLQLVRLIDEDAPPCYVDERAVVEIMQRLVDNAIQYTPSPGLVELSVNSNADYSSVFFRVRDSGVGMGEDERRKVFGRGYRGRASRDRSVRAGGGGGDGQGLDVVRHLVARMDGRIELDSPGGIGGQYPGTVVTVFFTRRSGGVAAAGEEEQKG